MHTYTTFTSQDDEVEDEEEEDDDDFYNTKAASSGKSKGKMVMSMEDTGNCSTKFKSGDGAASKSNARTKAKGYKNMSKNQKAKLHRQQRNEEKKAEKVLVPKGAAPSDEKLKRALDLNLVEARDCPSSSKDTGGSSSSTDNQELDAHGNSPMKPDAAAKRYTEVPSHIAYMTSQSAPLNQSGKDPKTGKSKGRRALWDKMMDDENFAHEKKDFEDTIRKRAQRGAIRVVGTMPEADATAKDPENIAVSQSLAKVIHIADIRASWKNVSRRGVHDMESCTVQHFRELGDIRNLDEQSSDVEDITHFGEVGAGRKYDRKCTKAEARTKLRKMQQRAVRKTLELIDESFIVEKKKTGKDEKMARASENMKQKEKDDQKLVEQMELLHKRLQSSASDEEKQEQAHAEDQSDEELVASGSD